MNGEDETQKLARAVVNDLTGLNVTFTGKILGDHRVMKITPEGAQEILDHLRGRGYKVTRV